MFNSLEKICSKFNIDFKFIKFLLVGVLNTIAGYSVFATLIFTGCHYAVANFFVIIFGIIFNFFSTGRLVFRNKNNSLFLKFFNIYALTWFTGTGFIYFFKHIFDNNIYFTGFLILIPNAILSFILMKYYVFKNN
ncbi:GtrA family protein [bacterium]|nr:GtrA family protein [bacterium]